MTSDRTIRTVPDLSRREEVGEIKQEGNLLIEAVSLLVQRQRETETWISEQLWQAEQRAADTERRYAELEQRLAGIESHLAQLVNEMEPGADDGRIALLREQIQDLRGEPIRATDEVTRPIPTAPIEPIAEDRAPRSARAADAAPLGSARAADAGPRTARGADAAPPASAASVAEFRSEGPAVAPRVSRGGPAPATASAASTSVTFWELLGSTPEDRFGIVLIGLGAIAVLYALLSQLRFG